MLEFLGLCVILYIAWKILPDLIGFLVKIILGFIIIVIMINLFGDHAHPIIFIR